MSFFRIGISYHFFLTYQVWRLSKKKERKTLQILTNFYKLIPILGLENKLYKLTHNISNKFFAFIYAKWIFKNFSQNKKKTLPLTFFWIILHFFHSKNSTNFAMKRQRTLAVLKFHFGWIIFHVIFHPVFLFEEDQNPPNRIANFFFQKNYSKKFILKGGNQVNRIL